MISNHYSSSGGCPHAHPTPAAPGLALRGKLDYVNADEWLDITNKGSKHNTDPSPLKLTRADLSIQKLSLFERDFNTVKVSARPNNDRLQFTVANEILDGNIEWQSPKNNLSEGKIVARFKKLHIPSHDEKESGHIEDQTIKQLDTRTSRRLFHWPSKN